METANEFKTGWSALITKDVKHAFNRASYKSIVQKLQERKMSDYLINFVTNYLTGGKNHDR